jgi:hypothetical protein
VIFEKPSLKLPISLDVIGYLTLTVLISAFVTYGFCVFSGIVGGFDSVGKITILDVINAFAQFATALTFILAFSQYRKNIIQQRQLIIAAEAKSQLDAMIQVIGNIKIGNETNLTNLDKSITLLANLAVNFDELFKEMHEDVQRAIVRMQWQNMYFNHLRHVLLEIDIVVILKEETDLDHKVIEAIADYEYAQVKKENTISVFEGYVLAQKILGNNLVNERFSLKGKIAALNMFTLHFLNNRNLNDLLYGLMSIVDIRAVAPVLAAAEPSEWAIS